MELQTETVLTRLQAADDRVFGLGDVLDTKASIGLVIITFLAIQTAEFLATDGPGGRLQLWAALSLTGAGALALLELWPREYQTESPESWDGWLEELRDYYGMDENTDVKVDRAFTAGIIRRAKERLEANKQINQRKSSLMTWCFRFTAVAFALNLTTLLLRASV